MSPEQHSGEAADGRSDQFSFCAALYEALYKTPPFAGDTLLSLGFNVRSGRLRPAPNPTPVPAVIERALKRGLAVDPAQRFPSMQELLSALDVDPQRDPSGASFSRRLFSYLFVVILLINAVFIVRWTRAGALTLPRLFFPDLALFLGAVAVAWSQRRSLLQNAFHRGVVGVVLIMLVQTLAVRAMAWYLPLNTEQVLTLDMVMMGGLFLHTAVFFLRGTWLLVLACVLGATAKLLFSPLVATVVRDLVYPLVAITFVGLWSRAAGEQDLCEAEAAAARLRTRLKR
jgi:hypothetical protein